MGPGASPHLGTGVMWARVAGGGDLTHYDGIHGEVFLCQG
jgi:hypothetical protein